VNLVPTFLEGPDRGTALLILEKIAGGTIPRIEPLNVRSTDGRRLVVIPQAGYLPADPGGRPGMVFLTFRDVTDLQKARNEAVKNQGRLRSLASRLASSEEEGRWRISRQLHDTVIQTLSLVRMRLASLSDRCDDGLTKHELEEILKWISTATGECRQLMADLNPSMLYELGLVPALNDLAVKFRSLHAVLVSVEGKDNVAIADRSLLGFLFHATRELMTNAVKHSGASRISVLVGRADGGVEVSVRDDGRGFDPEHVEASIERRTGFGLFSVRERLDGLGGQIRIKSEIGKGTLVTIFLPLDGRARPSLIRTAGMGGAGEGGRS
jgi:signal transduction histidine kinase